MLKEDAKHEALRLWLSLSPEERRTDRQAAEFAMLIHRRFDFRVAGDPYQIVKGWLQQNLSQA